VLPADGSKVGKQRFRDHFAAATQVIERTVEIYGVPERDSGGDEGKPARTVLLRLDRTIAQPAEAVETDSAARALRASPLLSSTVACRRSPGSSSQSSMNSVRSIRPISRRAAPGHSGGDKLPGA